MNADEKLKIALDALHYIAQPTMGYSPDRWNDELGRQEPTPAQHVREGRRPDLHSAALATCIEIATDALGRMGEREGR